MSEQKQHHYGLLYVHWQMDNIVAFGMFWFDENGRLACHRIDEALAKKVCDTFIGKDMHQSLGLNMFLPSNRDNLYKTMTKEYWEKMSAQNLGRLKYSKLATAAVPKYEQRHFDSLYMLAI